MPRYLVILVLTVVFFIVSCQTSMNTPDKSLSAATCTQDVVDAWDACCESNNFYPCPPDIASGFNNDTMGDTYSGSDYAGDVSTQMLEMQDILNINCAKDPCIDDLLSAVIHDPVWYD